MNIVTLTDEPPCPSYPTPDHDHILQTIRDSWSTEDINVGDKYDALRQLALESKNRRLQQLNAAYTAQLQTIAQEEAKEKKILYSHRVQQINSVMVPSTPGVFSWFGVW